MLARGRSGPLAVLAAAELMLVLDVSIVNVALPAIRGDLGFGSGGLEWVVNGYALTFGGFLLLGGRLADLLGGRRTFLAALSGFSGASLLCGLAGGPALLVAARLLQGLAAGLLSPATLSILAAGYPEGPERTRALSVWTAVAIGGGAIGSVLGGAITGVLSWRWIFFVNVPVGALLVALGRSRLPRSPAGASGRHVDVAGAVAVTAGLTAVVWGLIAVPRHGWGSAHVLVATIAGVLLLGGFVLIEARAARAPLVPLSVFRSRPLRAGNLLSLLSFAPVPATWFFLTLYLQAVRGRTPLQTGLLFLPLSLAVIAGSQAGFRALRRRDPRLPLLAGGALAALAMAWLARLPAAASLAWVIVPAGLVMLGGGLMLAPITASAVAGVPPEQAGLASGLMNTTRQLGGAIGLAALGAIAAAHGAAPVAGYRTALLAGAAIFALTALAGGVILPGRLQPSGG